MLKNYLFFLLYLLVNPHLFIVFLKRLYLPSYIQYNWLRKYRIQTIVEVGASVGNVLGVLIHLFPKARIYAFEPLEVLFQSLSSKFKDKNITIENYAVSNETGRGMFYQNEFLPASSLLPLKPKIQREFQLISKTKKIEVPTVRLDDYFKGKVFISPVFLKIDTQGTEKLVLEGAKKLLQRTSIIYVETSFEGYYNSQSYFEDIYRLITKLGFEYKGSFVESQFYPIFNLPVSVNSIFVNKLSIKK